MNLALAFNHNLFRQSFVILESLLSNHREEELTVFVLENELSEGEQEELRKYFCRDEKKQMVFLPVEEQVFPETLPKDEMIPLEAYFRLLLPELLPKEVKRVLYLDVDIVVLQNLRELYDLDFEEKLLISARDMFYDDIMASDEPGMEKRNAYFRSLYPAETSYFCSGVLLLNLEGLREKWSFQRYMECFRADRENIVFHDQDLLNLVHVNEVRLVDEKRYDFFAFKGYELGITKAQVEKTVSILHFAGHVKPWDAQELRYDIELLWWEYAKKTPYYRDLLEKAFYQTFEASLLEQQLALALRENAMLRQELERRN